MSEYVTVSVKQIDDYPAIYMLWQKDVLESDVRVTFKTISGMLEASEVPLYIIVDILNNPNIPIQTTISEAFWGPFRNPKLVEWIVVGTSSVSKVIGRTLSSISRRNNIQWFSTLDEAYAYLDGLVSTGD